MPPIGAETKVASIIRAVRRFKILKYESWSLSLCAQVLLCYLIFDIMTQFEPLDPSNSSLSKCRCLKMDAGIFLASGGGMLSVCLSVYDTGGPPYPYLIGPKSPQECWKLQIIANTIHNMVKEIQENRIFTMSRRLEGAREYGRYSSTTRLHSIVSGTL